MIVSKAEYDELVILSRETEAHLIEIERLREANRVLSGKLEETQKSLRIANELLDDAICRLNQADSNLRHLNLIKQSMELRHGVGRSL